LLRNTNAHHDGQLDRRREGEPARPPRRDYFVAPWFRAA
jgi:hypothetical protein